MKLTSRTARRVSVAAAAICAAILIPAVALAAPGPPAATTAAAAPGCSAADLTAWVGVPAGVAAGTFYYELELSNTSRHACTLYGFPGVSAFGSSGRQLGSAAAREDSHPARLVTLRRGGTAHVQVALADVSNYPRSACRPAAAGGLRVYAPNDRRAELIPFTFEACGKHGPKFLHVSAAIGGTGIPQFSS